MTLKICRYLFLLLIISLPLVRPFNTQIFGLLVPWTDFIFLLTAFFWVLSMIRRETSLRIDKFYFFLFLYVLALTLSTIFSLEPTRSFYKLLGEFYLIGLAVLTFNLAREKEFFKKLVYAWLLGTGLTILASMAGLLLFYLGFKTPDDNYFLSHYGTLPAGNYPRIYALFANFNMLCNFLNVSLMLAYAAGKFRRWPQILQIIFKGGIWLAAFFTFSPGLGGMFLSLAIWSRALFRNVNKFLFSRLVFTAGLVLALFFLFAVSITLDSNNTDQDFSIPFTNQRFEVSVRVLTWESSLKTFLQNPFLGKGTGLDPAFVEYQTLAGENQILLDAHNTILNIAGQNGLCGLAAFLALTIYLFKKCHFSINKNTEKEFILLALSAAFVGAFLYQSLGGSFEDARHLWVLFGLLPAAAKFEDLGHRPE